MKTIKYTAIILFSLLTACNKASLDVTPQNQLSDGTFWKTENDANLALVGCYNNWETFMNIVFMDGASDNGYEQFDYGYQAKGNGQFTPNSYIGSWVDMNAGAWFTYSRIRKYNNFLAKIDNVQMDATKKDFSRLKSVS